MKIVVNNINTCSTEKVQNTVIPHNNGGQINGLDVKLPEILFLTTYPPRECGIATYSQDLINALNNTFNKSFEVSICSLETNNAKHDYNDEVKYNLNTDRQSEFSRVAKSINENPYIRIVVIQHEFGLFEKNETGFIHFLSELRKPAVVAFHTVLPHPDQDLKYTVQQIAKYAACIITMTKSSENTLLSDYELPRDKINVIAHGTHLVPHSDKHFLKQQYNLTGKKILSTFGLLSSGKSIETTLKALPYIIRNFPDVVFLIIGKSHPSVVMREGELYREMLTDLVASLQLQDHVRFINCFLPLPELLDYLQLTDIYLFTSKDPNQAVSGTFSYAISSGCPVISTPIPHAIEVLQDGGGMIIDFESPQQLSKAVISLLSDESLQYNISSAAIHRMAPTAWENAAIAHALLFDKMAPGKLSLHYKIPPVNLNHLKKMTTDSGIIQFSIINRPDINSGYTLDDNARALIALCMHYELTGDPSDLEYIKTYFNFIKYCLQDEGCFLNYVDEQGKFTSQNDSDNLEDANGRAVWALGFLIYMKDLVPAELTDEASVIIQKVTGNLRKIHSTRAMAFIIKGLYYRNIKSRSEQDILLIKELADRMVQMYRHECGNNWNWYESYLTYANSILPEAMLCAWLSTGNPVYREIARTSFDFLLSKVFPGKTIQVISNKSKLNKLDEPGILPQGGEQPIDIAYTILALKKFSDVFREESYRQKMIQSFEWFLGNNHLHQVIYNPCTGGCYDGLETDYVNLNQGAESTVSYLMARLTIEKYLRNERTIKAMQLLL